MGAFVVEGQHRLQGTVRINGAKNSALKLMVAALLGQGVFNLENVPASQMFTPWPECWSVWGHG